MSHSDDQFADSEQPESRSPRQGAYHQIASLTINPVLPRSGSYQYGKRAIASSVELDQRSLTPPPKRLQKSHSTLWTPIWLSRAVLIAFAIAFLIMLLATALLYDFSEKNSGLSVQREANHYAWKYGPTAGETR